MWGLRIENALFSLGVGAVTAMIETAVVPLGAVITENFLHLGLPVHGFEGLWVGVTACVGMIAGTAYGWARRATVSY